MKTEINLDDKDLELWIEERLKEAEEANDKCKAYWFGASIEVLAIPHLRQKPTDCHYATTIIEFYYNFDYYDCYNSVIVAKIREIFTNIIVKNSNVTQPQPDNQFTIEQFKELAKERNIKKYVY